MGEEKRGATALEFKVRWFLGNSFRKDEKQTKIGARKWSQGPDLEGQAPSGSSPFLCSSPSAGERS